MFKPRSGQSRLNRARVKNDIIFCFVNLINDIIIVIQVKKLVTSRVKHQIYLFKTNKEQGVYACLKA